MSTSTLLVTFCNQTASPRQSGALVAPGEGECSWLPLDVPGLLEPGSNGLCGACQVGNLLALATQSTPPQVVLFDPVDRVIRERRELVGPNDVHSMVYVDGTLFLVSTGTNQIFAMPVSATGLGEPRLHWTFPDAPTDRDVVHLNGLTADDGQLIATCFGPRNEVGEWVDKGALFRVSPYRVFADGLRQPHTPMVIGDRLFCAESGRGRVHLWQRHVDGDWEARASIDVGGYVRGITGAGDHLWVGVSADRRVSRSKGTVNEDVPTAVTAVLARIDLATAPAVSARFGLAGLGEEIYDLLLLEDTPVQGALEQALTRRIGSLIDTHAVLRAEYAAAQERLAEQAARFEGELARTRAALQAELAQARAALQAEQVYSLGLERALQTVTESKLWRGAQWLRRLAGREPYQPQVRRPDQSAPAGAAGPGAPPAVAVAAPPAGATVAGAPVPKGAMTEIFREIFVDNVWGSEVSHSGTGSDLVQTAVIREVLPGLLRDLGVASMLDIPCGDFHWMQTLDLEVEYIGADVVPDLIERNNARYGNERRRFQVVDIANEDLPRVDLIFCRDLLVHFSFIDALRAVANLKRSGATWLLTTTFTDRAEHCDIATGQWRALNLRLPPFNFPPPVRLINEGCTEGGGTDWADKSLGLWRLADL